MLVVFVVVDVVSSVLSVDELSSESEVVVFSTMFNFISLHTNVAVNVSSTGVLSGRINENIDPGLFDRGKIRELAVKYKGEIIGLKIRQGAEIAGELGLKPLEAAIDLAEELGLPIMVHCTNPPGSLDDMVNLLHSNFIATERIRKEKDLLQEIGKKARNIFMLTNKGVKATFTNLPEFIKDIENELETKIER